MTISGFKPSLDEKGELAALPAASDRNRLPVRRDDALRSAVLYAEVAVTVRRSRPDVAAVMFDPRYDKAWIAEIRKSVKLVPGPIRQGTKIAREWRWLGRNMAETTEVTEYLPHRSVAMTTQLPFDLRIRYALEGIPEGTIVRVYAEGRATGLLRLIAQLLNPLLRTAVLRDLQRLKALLESGAWRRWAA